MIDTILEKFGLKEKIYSDGEYPPQKKKEHYRIYNNGTLGVVYSGAHVFEMSSAGGPNMSGHHIAWQTYPSDGRHGTIVGFCYRFPKVGELIVSRGVSEMYHYVAVTKIDSCRNPSDMFFADIITVASFKKKLTDTKTIRF